MVFKLRSRRSFSVRSSHTVTIQLLDAVRERAPWARVGNQMELQRHWKEDTEGFIASVLAKRERMRGVETSHPETHAPPNKPDSDDTAIRPQHESDYQNGMS